MMAGIVLTSQVLGESVDREDTSWQRNTAAKRERERDTRYQVPWSANTVLMHSKMTHYISLKTTNNSHLEHTREFC